ncbi:MAG: hypothetical protein ACSLE4_08055 [Methyloceanibacter sp.]|uniref:hypothetical protein n=1 Tax=Methyloceanibacter sp. TaxID=1965321 RepID=UPI003EE260AE
MPALTQSGCPIARRSSLHCSSRVYRALSKACERAGILVTDKNGKKVGGYYGSHAIGRHAFASRLLADGKSVKFVAEAGGGKARAWCSTHMGTSSAKMSTRRSMKWGIGGVVSERLLIKEIKKQDVKS